MSGHLPFFFTSCSWAAQLQCLHRLCPATLPTAEHLDLHIKQTHFASPHQTHIGIHPFNSLAAVHAAAERYQPPLIYEDFSQATPLTTRSHNPDKKIHSMCTKCDETFSRPADLERHAKKHLPGMKVHKCLVAGCDYEGNYWKDKLDQHFRKRH